MSSLENQVALVTGAGRGIGREIALELARAGADVVCVSRTEANSQSVADEVQSLGRRAWALAVDVGDSEAVSTSVETVLKETEGIHILVNNAGVTQSGSVNDTPVTSTDFFPTILDMARIELELPLPIDGVSFTSALRGKRHDRGAMYWHYPHYGNQGCAPTAAVREGDWKLIEWYENGKLELFNLKDDIAEKNDLAKKHPDKAKVLAAKLANWRKHTGAVMPALNKKFDPKKREGR